MYVPAACLNINHAKQTFIFSEVKDGRLVVTFMTDDILKEIAQAGGYKPTREQITLIAMNYAMRAKDVKFKSVQTRNPHEEIVWFRTTVQLTEEV